MEIGKYNRLFVRRETPNGLYLSDSMADEGDVREVLLPRRYVKEGYKTGSEVEVFLYTDSEDRLVATTTRPAVTVGEIASLKVADVSKFGAFMDWGLLKDLFVPFCNQAVRMQKGQFYPVTAYVDGVTGRVVGTSKISHMISNAELTVSKGDEVTAILARRVEKGFRVIVNSRHWGMIYDNQIYKPMSVGDTTQAWVSKITEDRRIDLMLSQPGYSGLLVAVEALKNLLDENGGQIDVGDRSDSEFIKAKTGLSKKVFKRAVGVLLKEGKITVSDFSVTIKQ